MRILRTVTCAYAIRWKFNESIDFFWSDTETSAYAQKLYFLDELWPIMLHLRTNFICFWYAQVSYMILQMVSPVTHAVGNSVKRVVVIVSTVFFFRTPVSPINSLGMHTQPRLFNFIFQCFYYMHLRASNTRNCFGSCWSFLVFKSKEDQTNSWLIYGFTQFALVF